MSRDASSHDNQRTGAVNPLGGRIHHPLDDQDRRRWAGFIAYVKVCPVCDWENDEQALFCSNCAADIRLVEATRTSNIRPGAALLAKRLEREQRQAQRTRRGESQAGGGWIAVGAFLVVGALVLNLAHVFTLGIWIVAVALAILGIWQLRFDAHGLRVWGTTLASIAMLLLGFALYQSIQTPSLAENTGNTLGATPPSATLVSDVSMSATPSASPLLESVTMYQGSATHDGLMPGPAPTTMPQLAWQADTGGELYAAPALYGGLLYITSKGGDLLAVNASSGDIVWTQRLSPYVTRGTPAVEGNVVFAGGGFEFGAFDAKSGETLWKVPIQYGGQASPTIAGDLVLVTSQQGWIYALDRRSGETSWRLSTDGIVFGAASVSEDNVVFGTDEGIVYNVRLDTGRTTWRTLIPGSIFATPVISGGRIYVATTAGELRVLDLEKGNVIWTANHGSAESVAVNGELVVISGSDGGIYGLDASTGALRWLHPTGSNSVTAPVIVDDLVLVGSGDRLIALDADSGEATWYFLAGDRIESPAVVADGYVYFGARDGFLYAITAP